MKYNIIFFTYILSIGLLISSCEGYLEIDKEPNKGKIFGTLLDGQGNSFNTDNNRETSTISLSFETDSVPLTFRVKPDGSFAMGKLIEGSYNIALNGPFFPIPEQVMNISGATNFDVVVTPFLEYTISQGVETENSITISYKIIGNNTAQPNIKAFVWSTHPYPAIAEFSGGDRYFTTATADIELVNGVQTGSYTIADLESKTSYYIRMCGRAAESTNVLNNNGYYNYSNQLVIQTQ